MVEVRKITAKAFKRSPVCTAVLSASNSARDHHQSSLCRDSWTLTCKSGSVSYGVTAPFPWILVCTRFCANKFICPVLF